MTGSTAIPRDGKPGPTPERMALLHTMAFTALRLSLSQLDEFSRRLVNALAAAAEKSGSVDDAELLRSASEHLSSNRATFHRLLGDSLQHALLEAVDAAAAHVRSGLTTGAMDLSLITFDAMERKVLLDNLSQAIDTRHADLLAILSMRVAHWLESEEIGNAQNPFRSEVFLKACSDAWTRFDMQGGAHHLVLHQLRPDVFLRLTPTWEALNQEFAVRKVLPDAEEKYRHRSLSPESLPAPSHVDTLRQWLAPEGTIKLIDARAMQLLDKVFAGLQKQDRIPQAIRHLLTSLRAPVSRAMLADADFFFSPKEPVRRLLETMLDTGLGCTPEDATGDPVCQSITRIIASLQKTEIPLEEFVTARREIEALSAQEDDKVRDRVAAMAEEAIKQENIARAQSLAEDDVASRIETGDVPRFIEVFLQTHWIRVLAYAHGVATTRPDVLPGVLKAMDDVIGSVQPKADAAARTALVHSLPALLAVLNSWLDVVKWDGAEREAFFSALAERHAAALRGPVDLSPRAQLEVRMDVMQKASEHELGRRIREQHVAALSDFMRLIDTLKPGSWAEFVRNDGSRVNCRLLWVSPGRGRFLFTGRHGQLLFTLADDAIAQALKAERIVLLPADGLFAQALADAMRELGLR